MSENKNFIIQLKNLIQEYKKVNYNELQYSDFCAVEHCFEKLLLLHEITKIKVKSEILKNEDFMLLCSLNETNFIQLIEIKKLYKNKKGIYLLSFSNGKVYVGQTNNLSRRLDEYFDINTHTYKGHNEGIKNLFKDEINLETKIYFLEAEQDRNLLEKTYIEKFQSSNPLYGYNEQGGNE